MKLADKHQLPERDEAFAGKSFYLPAIPWYYAIAAFRTQRWQGARVRERMLRPLEKMALHADKITQIEELLEEIKGHAPAIAEEVSAWLNHRFPAEV